MVIRRFDLQILHIKDFIWVREIGSNRYLTDEYVFLDFYIIGRIQGRPTIVYITREVHVVDSLKVKMLIGVNVFKSESIIFNFRRKILIIKSCQNLIADIHVFIKDNIRVRRVVRA